MSDDLTGLPQYRLTMEALERSKHLTAEGAEYWLAREVCPILGYAEWRNFEDVMDRAREALIANHIEPSHHFVGTTKMVGLGSGSQRQVDDHFLSRAACYLTAMNGDPTKPEIAAAQAYFAIQTRRMEVAESMSADEERLRLREKIKKSHKRVSGVAQDAGVRNNMQGIFHDARYQGLYGMSLVDLKLIKGLKESEQIFDRAGPLELSANDFQMNLAADVIAKEGINGEQPAIRRNKEIASQVRRTITLSGGTMPENLPLEPPIKEVERRLKHTPKITGPST